MTLHRFFYAMTIIVALLAPVAWYVVAANGDPVRPSKERAMTRPDLLDFLFDSDSWFLMHFNGKLQWVYYAHPIWGNPLRRPHPFNSPFSR